MKLRSVALFPHLAIKLKSRIFLFFFSFIQTERDDLVQQREQLSKRLESNECLLREKEDEVFLQLERVVYLEEQCDKVSWVRFFFIFAKFVLK